MSNFDKKAPASASQTHDQLDALPESTGTQNARPVSQRADTQHSGTYDGSPNDQGREDKPGLFSPQDDSPSLLKKSKETTKVKSTARPL